MRLKELIAAPKADIKVGSWHTGKVPRKDFPLARSAYRLGSAFQWCVIAFTALGSECRVLVIFNDGKQKYEAILGVMGDQKLCLLCSYEFHATEPGWHAHASCDDARKLPPGVMRGPWVKRIPAARQPHRRHSFHGKHSFDKAYALQIAYDRYRIEPKGPLL